MKIAAVSKKEVFFILVRWKMCWLAIIFLCHSSFQNWEEKDYI